MFESSEIIINIQEKLIEFGFDPILHDKDKILVESVSTVMSFFGKHLTDVLYSSFVDKRKVSKEELFKNYDLTKKIFEELFGEKATKTILKAVKEEISLLLGYDYVSYGIQDILEIINKNEAMKFFDSLKGGEHILCFHTSDSAKKSIITKFFGSQFDDIVKGISSVEPSECRFVNNFLFSKMENSKSTEMIVEWIRKLVSSKSNMPVRLACGDVNWWYNNNLGLEYQKLESSFSQYLENNMIRICIADVTKLKPETVSSLIKLHGYVLLDDPLMIYYKPYETKKKGELSYNYKFEKNDDESQLMDSTAIIVDDDDNTGRVFSDILEILGVKVLGRGYDGEDAVLLYKKCKPHIIFTDIMMPQTDGFYALKKIREFDPDAKVVAVTADISTEIKQKLDKMNVSAIIYKPFSVNEIKKTLRNELKMTIIDN